MSKIIKKPPYLFTYWKPLSKGSSIAGSWFDYVKDTSLAKYTADSMGRYMAQTSEAQIVAIESAGRRICGALNLGFTDLKSKLEGVQSQLSGLQYQLAQLSGQLGDVQNQLRGVNQRLGLLVDEAKTSNLLNENIAELLRIPDSAKQGQLHIERGLTFLKNALKNKDLYKFALHELLEAEKYTPYDYFILHRIGLIYLYVPAHGNLTKALDYFDRAAILAAAESDPCAARLVNILNKDVKKRVAEQVEPTDGMVSTHAAESYFGAGTALYALGRFARAAKMAEQAVNCEPKEAKYHFFLAKYLVRSKGDLDSAVHHFGVAIDLAPEMALAAINDLDLNRSNPVLNTLNQAVADVDSKLAAAITQIQQWPEKQPQRIFTKVDLCWTAMPVVPEDSLALPCLGVDLMIIPDSGWRSRVEQKLGAASYLQKRALIAPLVTHLELLDKLTYIVNCGFRCNLQAAYNLLKHYNNDDIDKLSKVRLASNYIKDANLNSFRNINNDESAWLRSLLGTLGNDAALLATADESYFVPTGTVKWKAEADTVAAIAEDGTVYIGRGSALIAISGETGKQFWSFAAGSRVGTPVVGGYMVFVHDEERLYALDGRTGRRIWERSEVGSVRIVNGEGSLFAFSDKVIRALAGETGKELWRYELPEPCHGSITAGAEDSIFFGVKDTLTAIHSQSGKPLWNLSVLRTGVKSRMIDDEGVVESNDGTCEVHWYTMEDSEESCEAPLALTYDAAGNCLHFLVASCTRSVWQRCYRYTHEECVQVDAVVNECRRHEYVLTCVDSKTGRGRWEKRWERGARRDEPRRGHQYKMVVDGDAAVCVGLSSGLLRFPSRVGGDFANAESWWKDMCTKSGLYPFTDRIRGVARGIPNVVLIAEDEAGKTLKVYTVRDGKLRAHVAGISSDSADGEVCPVIVGDNGMLFLSHGKTLYSVYSNCGERSHAGWPMFRQNPQGTCCATQPHFRVPTQEQIEREARNRQREAAEAQRIQEQKQQKLIQERHEQEMREARRIEMERILSQAVAAEAVENGKWFRKKDFRRARELYAQAAALGSAEAAQKIQQLPS